MKKAIIGGFLFLTSALIAMVALVAGAIHVKDVPSWHNPPGRFMTAMNEIGMTAPMIIFGALCLVGLWMLLREYVKKDEK